MPKGVLNKRYTPEFKKLVIETMRQERLSYSETRRRFEINSRALIKSWERIYLEEGPRNALPSNGGDAKTQAVHQSSCQKRWRRICDRSLEVVKATAKALLDTATKK
ncbi:transposase [uncultured Dysosmobacter sp.]|uniref:transposase n=1 Tax=uncultured Dysosmobacter sp. TaxID=2591384 RepID=UPI00262336EF|nr:transposase [uncultured Dysosmobacter sp.]